MGLEILIADGDQNFRSKLGGLIIDEFNDANITYAMDGNKANENLKAKKYDFVISQTNLLGYGGYQLLINLRREDYKSSKEAHFILMGNLSEADAEKLVGKYQPNTFYFNITHDLKKITDYVKEHLSTKK